MPFERIYKKIIEHAPLSDQHRDELIVKRGFSDETIKKFRFGSGGPGLAAVENEFLQMMERGEMREQDLVLSGAFIHDGKCARINPILLRDRNVFGNKEIPNILIPYQDKTGEITHVRSHKLGFSGIPSEIFQEWNLRDNPPEIILTEGEFKAVAAMQYDFPAISIPGISSFSETKFPELMKKLKEFKVRRIVIMFDNETKDDPNIPDRYKSNPTNRYDTQFYAYYMASRLEKEGGFEVAIATLPDGWKENGKIDIDGASAQMKTRGEMKKIVYDALARNEYLKELSFEAKQIVLRKNQQKYHRSKIRKEFNRYIITKTTQKGSFDLAISNFVMRVIATHETPDGVNREIEFINEFGRKSTPFTILPEQMSSGDAFRTFALSRGDFIWRGLTDDLLTIWESEFLMMDEGRYIVESDHVGYVGREKLWLFGNVAITDDGKELRPDQNGIFWLEKRGIKPVSLSVTSGKNAISEGVPYLNTGNRLEISEIKMRLSESIGQNETAMILGWISAISFMEEVFVLYRSFPFIFITGKWQSGKSTVAEWVSNFFGLENAGKSMSETTAVAIQRSLSYYSCLPVYLDEYRNTKEVLYKNGFLRNVYNRQGAGKGLKDSTYELREAKVRGTLIIAGEETPKDGALLSRCVVVFVSQRKRLKNHFDWFVKNRTKLSGYFLELLRRKNSLLSKFLSSLLEWKDYFIKNGTDDRTSLNYATIVAGYTTVYGDDIDFANWMAVETKVIQLEHSEEQAISIFMDDLVSLKTRKLIDDNYWAVNNGRIFLYFHGICQIWAQEYRKSRGGEAFKEGSIRTYLKEEPGFLEANVTCRVRGQLKKCVTFDYAGCSAELRALVEDFVTA